MRDEKRIPTFCKQLQVYWKEDIPDWRFGQFMSNFLGWVVEKTKRDIFFIEDNEMSELLDEFFKKSGNKTEINS